MQEPTKLSAEEADIAYDAMCVWEWWQSGRSSPAADAAEAMTDRYGVHTMREQIALLLPSIRASFALAKEAGYEECFDYEFVPWFMGNCVNLTKSAPAAWVCDITKLPPGYGVNTKDGFAVFCAMAHGGPSPLVTTCEEGKPTVWTVFDTAREAQLDLIDDLEEHLRQFKEGEREFDDVGVDDMYVVPVTVHPDGSLTSEYGTHPPPEQ